jgi:hypothetical protein
VEQSPACASSASAGQLNHHPSTPDPHQLRQQPSEPHAARGPFQGAGVGHRACAVARSNEYSDKGKGARNGRSGNEKGHAQSDAGASTYSHPPCPGSHLKPRRSGKEPAVSSRAATTPAPALSSSSRSVTTIASRLLQPGPSPQHNSSRRSNRVVFHQETLIFNPNPYFHPTQNYFHGFTPRYNPYNRYYSLISSAMPSSSSILSSPIQNDEQPSHQTRLEGAFVAA